MEPNESKKIKKITKLRKLGKLKLKIKKSTTKTREKEEKKNDIEKLDEYELYPTLDDSNFNVNIAKRKEFNDNKYIRPKITESEDIEYLSNKICNSKFELAPHQLFVKNFLSIYTPYNSLLLYHGLGSGKTCSAISVSEEMRDYLKQIGVTKRIIVVASPNVQENFRIQLFDERKLELIDGLWNIRACTGNKYLKEINPMNLKGLSKENVVKQINKLINTYYLFLGYIEFSNYIRKLIRVEGNLSQKAKTRMIKKKLNRLFKDRLVVIDEVHNIRITDDKKDKRVANSLSYLINNVDKMRLLLLSATPMYNSYKEIIWLINLMNKNDGRGTIELSDVFNSDGLFKTDEDGNEIGKDLLIRKATGYISYVRGENPFKFPFKIWPEQFSPENSIKTNILPKIQLNGRRISQALEYISLYLTQIGNYQEKGYEYIIEKLLKEFKKDKSDTADILDDLDNEEKLGYSFLQRPIEALNIVYPYDKLDKYIENLENGEELTDFDIKYLVGKSGLERIMNYETSSNPPSKYNYEYKNDTYGRIFSPSEIGKYSGKIKNICDRILGSKGVVLIHSQYIDGGIVPIALALEELGFTRAGKNKSLFKTSPTERIDAITFKTKKELNEGEKFNSAKYAIISGDKNLSPDNLEEFKLITNENNVDGSKVKVVIISQAGSEGIDLKFIRQVHIMEPWYNMNRNEQIIGRAVRNCSHKNLPFSERNVEIYLYGTLLQENEEKEAADLYIYRLAEMKSILIGNVSRVLKETSVDCILNIEQSEFTEDLMNQDVEINLSSGKKINYKVGDKPYTSICDYKEKCQYTCKPSLPAGDSEIISDTYGIQYIKE